MEFTWIPLVLAALAAIVSLVLTLRGNVRAKEAQEAADLQRQRSEEQVTALRNQLKRLEAEAAAASAEKTASEKEHDLALQLAEIASQLEATSTQLVQDKIVDHQSK